MESSSRVTVAVIGNVDSGKSSLVGVLTRSVLDDGRGSARSHVFRHQHEKDSGRSSSVATEIMGFDGSGKPLPVDPKASRLRTWQYCHAHSNKTVAFVDLCGHEAYLKTTIYGLTGLQPDFGMVVVGANMGVSKMTREHVGIATALGIPVLVVITKIDLAPPDIYKQTYDAVCKTLKQARKMPYACRTASDVHTAATSILTDRITPIVCVNNVTGDGHDLLRQLLLELPPRITVEAIKRSTRSSTSSRSNSTTGGAPLAFGGFGAGPSNSAPSIATGVSASTGDSSAAGDTTGATPASAPRHSSSSDHSAMDEQQQQYDGMLVDSEGIEGTPQKQRPPPDEPEPGEVMLDSVFNVPGVGVVVAGSVLRGVVRVGDTMLLGPDSIGEFHPVTIRSIHVQYTHVDCAAPGGSAAFAIRQKGWKSSAAGDKHSWARKGMSLTHPSLAPESVWEFSAEILVLHHQTTLAVGYAPIVHCGVIAQCARVQQILSIDGAPVSALRTGDRAIVHFRWQYHPQFIHPGDVLLFREGRAKGVGRIRSTGCLKTLLPAEPAPAACP